MSPPRPATSRRRASGATWSPSPGTSTRLKAATRSRRCSRPRWRQCSRPAWAVDGEASEADGITEAWVTFETAVARGRGHVRLRDGACWTLLTTMTELKGHEERKGPQREKGVVHGAVRDRRTWLERRQAEAAELGYEHQPYCVIVGGGQGGIILGARLRRLGVPTIIVERNARAGDSWRNRYSSLCLHDPVWYDHLPYLPFPDDWPVFSPKDKIGDWLEMYTKVMELNYWSSTECVQARYDDDEGGVGRRRRARRARP